ncbi:MAG: hypothetical protein JO223_04680 [Hyphomicrobiales bacterium]|nr:hypothetical protein [Hyphomicrobiales bacterium]MBV8441426.1 hypothetical protein [Hyphomicrobiales bacterium]
MDAEGIRRLVAAAGFIFRGGGEHHWKGETPPIPPEAGEIVAVRIEHVLRSTPVLRGLAGREAFVITRRADAVRQSRSLILFTECISLGQQLLLREIDHVEASDQTSREVAEAIGEEDERPLRERIAGAELIVTGDVAESEPTESARSPKGEHDPILQLARVVVKSVLKGRKPAGKLEVLFASSIDIAWFKSPKLHPGASGIFLLRRARENEFADEAPPTAFQATDPLDFLPMERIAEVEGMLGEGRGGRRNDRQR